MHLLPRDRVVQSGLFGLHFGEAAAIGEHFGLGQGVRRERREAC